MTVDPYSTTTGDTTDAAGYGNPTAAVAAQTAGAASALAQMFGVTMPGVSGKAPVGVPEGYSINQGVTPPPGVPTSGPGYYVPDAPAAGQKIIDEPRYTYHDLAGLYGAPPDQVSAWQMRLYNMGLLDGGSFMVGIYDNATHDALENAMTIANANGLSIGEMEDILKQGKKTAQDMGWTSSGSGSGSSASYDPYTNTTNSTTVSTAENISLTGRGGARALLVQAMANEMGREPTKKEVSRFLRSLHQAERAHPSTTKSTTKSTTTTTTDPSPSGDSTTTSKTNSDTTNVSRESNVDPNQKAIQFARQHGGKEAQAFQAGQFMEVINSLIGL